MTTAELKQEIESGPLADELAPLVAAGNAAGVLAALTDPARRTRPAARVLAESGLMELLGGSSFANVFDHPTLVMWKRDVAAQNREGVALWAYAWAKRGLITDAERAAVQEYCTTPAQVPCSRADERGWAVDRAAVDAALTV